MISRAKVVQVERNSKQIAFLFCILLNLHYLCYSNNFTCLYKHTLYRPTTILQRPGNSREFAT